MRHKFQKKLFTNKGEGNLPQLIVAGDENTQSKFVVQKILELREEGIPLEEIAVLFRSSFLSFDLEIELTRANIPFVKFGGYKFIETAHVKDLIAYLRILENPRDVVSWHRVLLLIDGVGPRTAENVVNGIVARRQSDHAALPWRGGTDHPEAVRELFETFDGISRGRHEPADTVARLITYYLPMFKRTYEDHTRRRKDLDAFEQIAGRYRDIPTLLADLALEPPTESIADIASPGKETEYLTLSTIHSAKGLEWHSVFIITALDGRFPTTRSADSVEEMEEERRLMYVACTRAKTNLFITYPINVYDRDSGTILTKPSRFLEGLDDRLIEAWVIENS